MNTRAAADLAIRPYVQADEPEVLTLLDRTLGAGPALSRSAEFFRWKHFENPFGPSFMIVAELDGRIVGLRAFMRWRFTSSDMTYRAARAVDTATDPDHQGKGIFRRLTLESVEQLRSDTDLIFNTPNSSSLPGYLKMGWSTVGTVPVHVRVRRPIAFARRVRTVRSDGSPTRPRPPISAPTAAEILETADVGSLLEEAVSGSSRALSTSMDRRFLAWRYGDAPLGYSCVIEGSARALRGVAFFRIRPRGELWESTVADVIVRPGDVAAASRLLRRATTASKVDHATCCAPADSVVSAALTRSGFLRAPVGETLVVNALTQPIVPDPTDLRAWAMSLGTLEVF